MNSIEDEPVHVVFRKSRLKIRPDESGEHGGTKREVCNQRINRTGESENTGN